MSTSVQADVFDQFYSPAQVAERLGVDRVVVYGWISQGLLRAYRIGP